MCIFLDFIVVFDQYCLQLPVLYLTCPFYLIASKWWLWIIFLVKKKTSLQQFVRWGTPSRRWVYMCESQQSEKYIQKIYNKT